MKKPITIMWDRNHWFIRLLRSGKYNGIFDRVVKKIFFIELRDWHPLKILFFYK